MTTWNDYLAAQGARHDATLPDQVADFGRTLSVTELKGGFVAPVTGQGLIAVRGEDAAKFLHSQLTNDVEHLGQGEARLAGYCTPKGRLQASFLMWRDADAVYLQLPRELQAALQKRLSMFVMRAKAALTDASVTPAFEAVLGFGGSAAQPALEGLFGALPALPYTRMEHSLGVLIRLADAFDAPRYQWLTTAATAQQYFPAFTEKLALGGGDAWRLSDIHAGVPQITLKTQEQFVPQMINFELLGGVNFKKGCYPGQEIVARSQYLGKLKRRTALASIAGALAQAGDEVFDVADPGQPCGMVVNSAPNGAGGSDALVEMKLAALAGSEVRLGSANGPALAFQPMPYPLDALDL
ncbi:MAG: folate-binding protein [Pseudomonadota bacterium]